ncbi:glycosyltransferase [Geoalkalibacter sp.]|uniref:glycosyltransferase n=1 Tax=Geoalkalibacter sp. TaxID=3041440 RepID=UPI00272EAACC|nr:glycosyltransferase [Geoalkalibacter sp.]
MRKSTLAIVLLVILANLLVWAAFNRPARPVTYTGLINGVSFSPYQKGQDPYKKIYPKAEQIDQDLALLEGWAGEVRTYSSADGLEVIPSLARARGLKVTAGAWLDRRPENNQREIANLIANANRYDNVGRVIVGNEAVLRGDLSTRQMAEYLREVRASVGVPVSTAEPWHVWLKYPELAEEVDFITIHLLPYWEGIAEKDALKWAMESYRRVQLAFPHKPILIGEIGWPSGGIRQEKANPSLTGQARFIREFLNVAAAQGLDYFIMEAFDQSWKRKAEGLAGVHWGLFDVDRRPKFSMTGEVLEVRYWVLQPLLATLLALGPMAIFLRQWNNLRRRGRLFYAALLQGAASLLIWSAALPLVSDMTLAGLIVWGLLLPAQAALLLVVLTSGLEMTEVLWVDKWKRHFRPLPPSRYQKLPKVSIHLAIHNEPPELVKQTLDGLARLDYPDFEVLVLDNNTVKDEVWQPVEEYCRKLGPRFRFFHLANWPGFKAGALNFGLTQTDPEAQVIGVIDADYVVHSSWLRSLVPYFEKPEVGFVQAPQDNREWSGDLFKTMINWEYNGFFEIGMVHRNERNAIIQHGTMTLVRREALQGQGGWSEWCICEDAELGMRLFAKGYEAVYVNFNFGDGITPFTFAGYKGQRFRWTYGAIQILRRHWRWLLPGNPSGLSAGQKFHFATGWFPWFADAFHLLFTFAGIFWTIGLLAAPKYFEFPLAPFIVPTLGLFLFKVSHALVLYRARVNCTFWQSVGAAIAGMGLTHVIARAVFKGLFYKNEPFLRTPKGENQPALFKGFLMAWEEWQICALLWLSAGATWWRFGLGSPEALLWGVLLLVQSLPYGAALLTSMANCMPTAHLRVARWLTLARRSSLGLLRLRWLGARRPSAG